MAVTGGVRDDCPWPESWLLSQLPIAGWRVWPEADFPRTHTLKVKRDVVRAWATPEAPLPVR